ncbi:MAG: hypothetical protein M1832_003420 [Thelocarpon impressellum]|nr:MAG: hypothetical protein M1832_003420 [Thelocarpon impressellum]
MEVSHPRRILALTPPSHSSEILTLLRSLTGTAPDTDANGGSTAGLSHAWNTSTAYYKATIPIWVDEVADAAEWSGEFLSPDAAEVLRALGAFVFCFRRPVTAAELDEVKGCLRAVARVRDQGCGHSWDGACLAVALPQHQTPYLARSFEEWEDLAREWGFEYVDSESRGRNEFGEPTGIERLKEALEANDWDGDDGGSLYALEDDGEGGFEAAANELQREMLDMHGSVVPSEAEQPGPGGEEATEERQVELVEAAMLKLQTVRGKADLYRPEGKAIDIRSPDTSADLPERERRKIAARAVGEVLRGL